MDNWIMSVSTSPFLLGVCRPAVWLAMSAILLSSPGVALAMLGGDEASIEVDRVRLKGTASVRHAPRYALHEIAQPSGVAVRQYVAPTGKVFAVEWKGPVRPDLRQVLGPHFDRYVAVAKEGRIKRVPVVIREASLVVVTGGHLRAFTGRAYVPDLVPPGVDAEALP